MSGVRKLRDAPPAGKVAPPSPFKLRLALYPSIQLEYARSRNNPSARARRARRLPPPRSAEATVHEPRRGTRLRRRARGARGTSRRRLDRLLEAILVHRDERAHET